MSVKVAIVGASGRTGFQVVNALGDYPDFELAAAIVSPGSRFVGCSCPGGVFTDDLQRILTSDVVIEFAVAERTLGVASLCAARGIPLVIGTTGHTDDQRGAINALATKMAILWAPNTSLGVFALRAVSRLARELLGGDFEVRVLDIHHSKKRDAPSGTAKNIAVDLGLRSHPQSDGGGVGDVVSIRGGDEPGHHSVYFLGKGERLEFSHVVHDRLTFGRGALRLAEMLICMPSGVFTIDDLYSRK